MGPEVGGAIGHRVDAEVSQHHHLDCLGLALEEAPVALFLFGEFPVLQRVVGELVKEGLGGDAVRQGFLDLGSWL